MVTFKTASFGEQNPRSGKKLAGELEIELISEVSF